MGMWDTKVCILEMFLCFYEQYGRASVSYRDFLREILYWYEKTYFKAHDLSCDDDVSTERMITTTTYQKSLNIDVNQCGDANNETTSDSSTNSSSYSSMQRYPDDSDLKTKITLSLGVNHHGIGGPQFPTSSDACVFPPRSPSSSASGGDDHSDGEGEGTEEEEESATPHIKVEQHRSSDEALNMVSCCPGNGLSIPPRLPQVFPGCSTPISSQPCDTKSESNSHATNVLSASSQTPFPSLPPTDLYDTASRRFFDAFSSIQSSSGPPPPLPDLTSTQAPTVSSGAPVTQIGGTTMKEQRLFECFVCGRHFSRSDNLQRHVRIHTGDRPFQCQACQLRFRRKDCLKTHMKSHHGNDSAAAAAAAAAVPPPQSTTSVPETDPPAVDSNMEVDTKE